MAREDAQRMAKAVWALAKAQHWVITRPQLLAIGYTPEAIDYRIEVGRLRPIHEGVFAVWRPDLAREGHFIAAVLACGDTAALSHDSGGELWEIRPRIPGPLHVSVLRGHPRRPGIKAHRRTRMETTTRKGIVVTTPACTIVDLAPRLSDARLERCINEAVNRNLANPEELRDDAAAMPWRFGARRVVTLLDRDTFVATETMLEQRFLRIVRKAGLPLPATQVWLPGGRVDFCWPDLKLVVEADSLRFHRTAAQQRTDIVRDQLNFVDREIHTLRFTHWQIFREPEYVTRILTAAIRRLAARAA
jgi:very-short-patch-repair endonuclease